MKRSRSGGAREGARRGRPAESREPIASGRRIRAVESGQTGEILEHACQYAHPKAEPVFNYLIRWDDGQVQAISEAALTASNGYELLDD